MTAFRLNLSPKAYIPFAFVVVVLSLVLIPSLSVNAQTFNPG
jgi:hypothetical protein